MFQIRKNIRIPSGILHQIFPRRQALSYDCSLPVFPAGYHRFAQLSIVFPRDRRDIHTRLFQIRIILLAQLGKSITKKKSVHPFRPQPPSLENSGLRVLWHCIRKSSCCTDNTSATYFFYFTPSCRFPLSPQKYKQWQEQKQRDSDIQQIIPEPFPMAALVEHFCHPENGSHHPTEYHFLCVSFFPQFLYQFLCIKQKHSHKCKQRKKPDGDHKGIQPLQKLPLRWILLISVIAGYFMVVRERLPKLPSRITYKTARTPMANHIAACTACTSFPHFAFCT